MRGRLPKKSSKSIRNSQQRSLSTGRSGKSASSRSSCSSKSSFGSRKSNSRKSGCDKKTIDSKIIYKPEEEVFKEKKNTWARLFANSLQVFITVLLVTSVVVHVIWGTVETGAWMIMTLMKELVACFLMVYVTRNYRTGPCCTLLAVQFALCFNAFSHGLSVELRLDSCFMEIIFSKLNISMIAAIIHLAITLQCIELIAKAAKRDDYSDLVIVESTEKRRTDLLRMIQDLLSSAAHGDHDVNMNLLIVDETGKPMKLHGSQVEATTNSATQLEYDGKSRQLAFTTIKTAEASVSVPKKVEKVVPVKSAEKQPDIGINSVYNSCRKQNKMLSPRRVL